MFHNYYQVISIECPADTFAKQTGKKLRILK